MPLLYLPTPCAHNHHFLDFRDSRQLMARAEETTADFLAEAEIPAVGQMSGAPHTHDGQPGEIARIVAAAQAD